jgi:hypothetical protein
LIEFVIMLPRSALGKLLKRELKKGIVDVQDGSVVLPDPAGAVPRTRASATSISESASRDDLVGGRFRDLQSDNSKAQPFAELSEDQKIWRADGNGRGHRHAEENRKGSASA